MCIFIFLLIFSFIANGTNENITFYEENYLSEILITVIFK